MFPLALKIIVPGNQEKGTGSHTVMTASLCDFSQTKGTRGGQGKSPVLGPHLSIYVNSVHDLGCQLLSSSSLAVRLRPPPPILKACGSLTKGQHSPVSCDPEAVSQVFPSYLLPPSNDCLATTSRAAIPEITALNKVCLGSQREILLKCYLGFSFFFFLSL